MLERAADPPSRQIGGGIRAALRQWPLALALYLPGLALGLVITVPVTLAAGSLSELGPWTYRLAEGDIVNTLMELSPGGPGGEQPPEVSASASGFVVSILLLMLSIPLQWLLYNLLVGGVLERVGGRSSRGFWAACWYWAWPMVRLGLASAVIFAALLGVGVILIGALPIMTSVAWLINSLLVVGLIAVLNGWLETTRASMVTRGDRRVLAALGRGVRLPALGAVFGVAVGLWLVLGLVGAAYVALGGALIALVPVGAPLLIFVAQQLFAFASAALKLLRLGVAVGVARASWPLYTGEG